MAKPPKESSDNHKYEFTGKFSELHASTVWQIRRKVSRADVDSVIGGWIEKEDNLSFDGHCWIFSEAKVADNARVEGNAQVFGRAQIYDDARVYENSNVYGDAKIYENAQVYGEAEIYGNAKVFGFTSVLDEARICGTASVFGYSIFAGYEYVEEGDYEEE